MPCLTLATSLHRRTVHGLYCDGQLFGSATSASLRNPWSVSVLMPAVAGPVLIRSATECNYSLPKESEVRRSGYVRQLWAGPCTARADLRGRVQQC